MKIEERYRNLMKIEERYKRLYENIEMDWDTVSANAVELEKIISEKNLSFYEILGAFSLIVTRQQASLMKSEKLKTAEHLRYFVELIERTIPFIEQKLNESVE